MARLTSPPGLSSALEVTTVGTGTCVPRLDRGGPCVLVRAPGACLAVDLGLGSLHGLLRSGVAHRDLDGVFLSHLHPDHVAELASLLFASNYDDEPRCRPLILAGGPGLGDFLGGLSGAFGTWLQPREYDLDLREVAPGGEAALGELRCRAGAVRHLPSSLAWRFERGGRSAVVSGDTGPSPELEDFARGADLLVLEASLPPSAEMAAHLTARQAGELARRAGVGRLVLTHFYPAAEAVDPAVFAAEAFGRAVVVATDGARFEV
ncbi:MAG: MBL fold metallo-hydrolase [Thermodesulfobacteriota bacterium]